MILIKDRLMIQYVRNGILYASEDHFVFQSEDEGRSWKIVCRLETRDNSVKGKVKNCLLRMEPVRRLRRNIGIHNVVVLPSGTILIQYDGIYRYDGQGKTAKRVFGFAEKKISGPLKNGFVVDDATAHIYWGEYTIDRPHAVRIIRGTDDGRKWEVCYQFPLGRIRHVHSLVPDPYRNRLWVCTGDRDDETALFYTEDDFQSVEYFNGGDQSWRMVSMIPRDDALYWGSDAGQDAPSEAVNHIYRWDFGRRRKERLQKIDKPAYYATVLKDGTMAMGVHHEPKIKRDVEPSAELWVSKNGTQWKKVLQFPYQSCKREQGTRYASIFLPLGDHLTESLFFTPLNVKKYDFTMHKLTLGRSDDI